MKTPVRIFAMFSAGLVVVAMCAAQAPPPPSAPAPAQAPSSDSSTQPVQPYGPLYQVQDAAAAQTAPVPDNRPLSGILGLTLGSMGATENTLTPSFRFGQVFDSNAGISGTQSDYKAETSFAGSLRLHRAGARQSLDVTYNGGTVVYVNDNFQNSFHNLSLAQVFNIGRWTLTLTDGLNYSPQGSLGAGLGQGGNGTGALALTGPTLSLTPNQGIYTPLSRQLGNTVGGQIQYGLSPRSSWTVGVTYGNVIYPDVDGRNTHQLDFRSGYNRNWTAKDTISVFYDYSINRGGQGVQTDSQSVQLGYARRVTGRLTWSVTAGPQIARFVGTDDIDVAATVSTSLQYERARTSVSLGFHRGVSQALIGATTMNSLQLGVNHRLSQRWSLGVNGTISRNTQLPGSTEFTSGFAGAQVQRTLGTHASIYFNYGYQRQVSNVQCAGPVCGGLSRQVFGFGFSWTPRSWILR